MNTESQTDRITQLEIERDEAKVATDFANLRIEQLEAACASSMLTFARFAEMIFRHEQNLQGVRSEQTTRGLPKDDTQSREGVFSEPVQEVQNLSLYGDASERSQAQGAQSNSLAKTKVEGPGEVSGVLPKVSQTSPGKPQERSESSGPVQGEMPNYPDQCGRGGKSGEAEAMPGVRLDGTDSWPSQRLQQALGRGVALRYLSREEAQEILNSLNTDAGKALLERLQAVEAQNKSRRKEIASLDEQLIEAKRAIETQYNLRQAVEAERDRYKRLLESFQAFVSVTPVNPLNTWLEERDKLISNSECRVCSTCGGLLGSHYAGTPCSCIQALQPAKEQ